MSPRALPTRPFWMVYGVGQRSPVKEHAEQAHAVGEAHRLALAHPGIVFVVLETIGAVVVGGAQTTTFGRRPADLMSDEIPF